MTLSIPGTTTRAVPLRTLHRLQNRAQFQAVLSAGTLSRTTHFALHGLSLAEAFAEQPHLVGKSATWHKPLFLPAGIWLGAMVPKRWAKRAVTRNTIKRQIYSICSSDEVCANSLSPMMAYVVRLRAEFDRGRFVSATSDLLKAAVRAELLQLLERIGRAATPKAAHTVTPVQTGQPS